MSIRVMVVGLPYFCERIFERHSAVEGVEFFNLAIRDDAGALRKAWSFIKRLLQVRQYDAIYSIWGGTGLAGCLMVLVANLLGKKIVLHWVGSDVVLLNRRPLRGLRTAILKQAKHWCECEWIKSELNGLSIKAEIVDLVVLRSDIRYQRPGQDAPIRVLSYVMQGKEEFYGLPKLLELAAVIPQAEFHIVGCAHSAPLVNVFFHGWVDDMQEWYRRSHMYLRLVQHDGLAFSVIEALAYGCVVFYSYDLPGVYRYESVGQFVACYEELINEHSLRGRGSDVSGRVIARYSRDAVVRRMARTMEGLVREY